MNTPAQVFSTIYQSGLWSPEPWNSGPGSDPAGEGATYCQIIPAVLKATGDRRVVDLGCGDGRIIANIAEQCKKIDFVGVDCCKELLAKNAATWPHLQNLRWEYSDMSLLGALPTWTNDYGGTCWADIYLAKDLLHHLPTSMIDNLMHWIDERGLTIIATQDSDNAKNDEDCELGGYRPLSDEAMPLAAFAPIVLLKYLHKSILMFRFD